MVSLLTPQPLTVDGIVIVTTTIDHIVIVTDTATTEQ